MGIRLYKEEDKQKWEEYVAASGNATAYHQIGWKRVVETSFGHRTHYLLSENDKGGIDGIFPMVQLKSFIFGNFFASLPYFNYGGICTDRMELSGPLLQEGIRIAREEGAEHLEVRETAPLDAGLPCKSEKVSMRLSLPGSADALWNTFPSKLKSQIKRPQRERFSVSIGGEDELDSFYRVFSINMKHLGTPVYPRRFFLEILRSFPLLASICIVRAKSEPVAAGFLIGFKNTMEIPWASSLREYNHLAPNMLLYWSALSFSIERGYGVFDFGRSTPGEGPYRFKAQWGAAPVPLHWYYWLREAGSLPELNPKNKKYRLAIELWKRLPLIVTQAVGPRIVGNLP